MKNKKINLLSQGAEAKIILEDNIIIKDRIPKSYRIKALDDAIRKQRTKKETKLLNKANEILNTPKPQELKNDFQIIMPFIDGKKLSDDLDTFKLPKQKEIMKKIGEAISKLHEQNIIHGDLTTSNMILKDNEVFFIDFGLGYENGKYEDKSVDIHLFKQALEAKHFKKWEELYEEFKKAYLEHGQDEAKKVIDRLNIVEKRGRYKGL